MRVRGLWMMAIVVALGGCNLFNAKQKEIEKRDARVTSVAQNYLQDRYPNWLKNQGGTPLVKDNGDTWLYTYKLPPGQYGAPVVLVNKNTFEVVRAYHTQ
jgi:hypothetical protein